MRTVLSALIALWRSSRTMIGLAVFRVLILVTLTSADLALEACASGVWQALSHTPTAHLVIVVKVVMPGRTGHVLCAAMGRHRMRSAHRVCCVSRDGQEPMDLAHNAQQGVIRLQTVQPANHVEKAKQEPAVSASSVQTERA